MLCTWALALSIVGCGGGGGGAGSSAAPLSSTDQGTAQVLSASKELAAITASPAAPGYYVDSLLGDNANGGTIERPWRTLARLSGVLLKAGEGIYLRCGQKWRETLSLNHIQLVDGSTVAGYGKECSTQKAVISGADDFSGGWALSAGVWSRSLPAGTPKISQFFVDGIPMRTAQWPDAGINAPQIALAVLPASSGTASRQSLGVGGSAIGNLPNQNLIGATIQIRTQAWMIETRRVVGQTGSTVELDNATAWSLQSGQGVVLQDQRWMLDSPGEFFHDAAGQRLYLIAPLVGLPSNLNTALVEGSVRDLALRLINRRGMSVRDLTLTATRDTGLRLTDAPGAQVTRVDARHNAIAGIQLQQWVKAANNENGGAVTDSLFAGNGQVGIDALHVSGALVARNLVIATGIGEHQQANVLAAISAGPAARVEDNVIDGSGYHGIRFTARDQSVIARNSVKRHCSRLSDCGGIYTWTGRASSQNASLSATVVGNQVFGGHANLAGTVADGSEVVAGIYIDDFSNGVKVSDNLLANNPFGVMVHNSSGTQVLGNRVWLAREVAIWATMDQTDGDWMNSNLFQANHIVPLVQAQAVAGGLPRFSTSKAIWFWHSSLGEAGLGPGRNMFSANTVVQLQGPLAAHAWLRGPSGERWVDAVEWKALNSGEALPLQPLVFAPVVPTLGPELVADSSMSSGLGLWRTWQHPAGTGFSISALSGQPSCMLGCISFTAGHPGDLLASQPFSLRAGKPYVYRWAASMPAAAGANVSAPYLSRETSPWDNMADGQGYVGYGPQRAVAGGSLSYETYFLPKASDASRVHLQISTMGVPVNFHAASVREVLAYNVAQPADWAVVVTSSAQTAQSFNCSDFGWPDGCTALGVDGQAVTLPLLLPAASERLLVRGDSPFRR